jgi:tRNA pseudouridine38-40 synthase
VQPKDVTVQAVIQDAIAQVCGEKVVLHGSGRTDQGVHARRQVAHFDLTKKSLPPARILNALNAVLPNDIRIPFATQVPASFHARYSAIGKEYRYFIWNGYVVPPFKRAYVTQVRRTLDVDTMQRAAGYLTGKHDFAAFTANAKRVVDSTVRTVSELSVTRKGNEIVIVAKAEGFLYKMVRSLAGFLIKAGQGAVPPSHAKAVLASRQRTTAVPTAPPEGLFLWQVKY